MSTPELKQKKVSRDKAHAAAAAAYATKAVAAKAEEVKAITARAQAYENEYNKVKSPFTL